VKWLAEAWRRLRSIGRRGALERGLNEELRFHVEQQAEKNRRAGLSPDEAMRQALVRFGGVERTKEGARDEFRPGRFEDSLRDVRYAARALGHSRGFTLAATLTIALGIGATTALFSVVNGVLIKPLPYPDAERLVDLMHSAPGINVPDPEIGLSAAQLFTYRDGNHVFDALGFYSPATVTVTGSAGPEQIDSVLVNDGTLRALGVQAAFGRLFSAEDDAPKSPETVLLTHGYWQSRFGGDHAAVGKNLVVDSRPRQIIGVMPRDFRFLEINPTIILPFRFDRAQVQLGQFNFGGIGRLKPGMTIADANRDLSRLVPILLQAWPTPSGIARRLFEDLRLTPNLRPLKARVVGNIGEVLWVLMGTISVVLVIACANVANLLVVRTDGRQQELAIRSALGASRGRLARALLVESVLLGLFGGALGVGLASAGLRLLIAAGPTSLPRLAEISVDPLTLGFALATSIASGLAFGLISVLRHTRPNLARELRAGGRSASASRERHRTRDALVVGQVALATVLVIAAGLMVRSFVALRLVQPGFTDPARVQLVTLPIPSGVVREAVDVFRVQKDIRDRIAAISGVAGASFASTVPLQGTASSDVLFVEHQTYAEGTIPPVRWYSFVAPRYFETVGTPFVAGRDFDWTEIESRRPVAIVSENFAREAWKDPVAALGKRVRDNTEAPWREIIGVVANVHAASVDAAPPTIVYWPALMENFWLSKVRVNRTVTFVIRSERAGTAGLIDEIRGAVQAVNGSLPVTNVRTLADLYDRSMTRTSFTLVMLAIAAAMALFLSVIGIYGVLSYTVAQRTREIGIRIALGAERGPVRRMFVRHGMVLASVGVAGGLVAAAGMSRLISSLLFGVESSDATTYIVASVVLVIAAALASYLPARRATRVSPVTALRTEI
jgi:putative ABC transport system permease protein